MKKLFLIFAIIFGMLTVVSCSDDDPDTPKPTPTTPNITLNTLKELIGLSETELNSKLSTFGSYQIKDNYYYFPDTISYTHYVQVGFNNNKVCFSTFGKFETSKANALTLYNKWKNTIKDNFLVGDIYIDDSKNTYDNKAEFMSAFELFNNSSVGYKEYYINETSTKETQISNFDYANNQNQYSSTLFNVTYIDLKNYPVKK